VIIAGPIKAAITIMIRIIMPRTASLFLSTAARIAPQRCSGDDLAANQFTHVLFGDSVFRPEYEDPADQVLMAVYCLPKYFASASRLRSENADAS